MKQTGDKMSTKSYILKTERPEKPTLNEMTELTKREVLAELKKLGINITSELKSYCIEYKAYTALQNKSLYP